MPQKDFDTWNEKKKTINVRKDTPSIFFKEQEIWWSFFGLNIDHEQDGKGKDFLRPVLVIKKFSPHIFYALPLTTKTMSRSYLIPCQSLDKIFRQVNISQMKVLDVKRLFEKITFVPK